MHTIFHLMVFIANLCDLDSLIRHAPTSFSDCLVLNFTDAEDIYIVNFYVVSPSPKSHTHAVNTLITGLTFSSELTPSLKKYIN